jgi:hypothetical protein
MGVTDTEGEFNTATTAGEGEHIYFRITPFNCWLQFTELILGESN